MRTNRRRFFGTVGTGAAGIALGSGRAFGEEPAASPAVAARDTDEPILKVGDNIAVTTFVPGNSADSA